MRALKKRRGGGEELLAYKDGRRWVDVKSRGHQRVPQGGHRRRVQREGLPHLERHGARRGGAGGVGAWHRRSKTVTQAREDAARSRRSSRYLGNTPAVCRASYIDPRVFDRFDGGLTIGGVLPELAEDTAPWPDVQGAVEEAVLDLLADDRESDPVEEGVELAAVA